MCQGLNSKRVLRREFKLRSINQPVPTIAFKSQYSSEETYYQYLGEQLASNSNIITASPVMYVAVDMCAEDCSICMESITDNEDVSAFSCNHIMHSMCLYNWISNPAFTVSCPMCRNAEIDNVFH